eukprot:TRINITY_DN6280_c0_g2_i1.p1 TRINITY_DN6280_c0_g2~~TRINITY_DN6280_c0_g2_i1.p1  ORF type:complete len:949 (+),score=248.17 TRINITY_DN6280_c0_g2_i1:124-2970(+)
MAGAQERRRPERPALSPDGGPQEADTCVHITLRDPVGHDVLYTLDSSEPTEAALGKATMRYDGPLRLRRYGGGDLLVTAAALRKADRCLSLPTARWFVVKADPPPQRASPPGHRAAAAVAADERPSPAAAAAERPAAASAGERPAPPRQIEYRSVRSLSPQSAGGRRLPAGAGIGGRATQASPPPSLSPSTTERGRALMRYKAHSGGRPSPEAGKEDEGERRRHHRHRAQPELAGAAGSAPPERSPPAPPAPVRAAPPPLIASPPAPAAATPNASPSAPAAATPVSSAAAAGSITSPPAIAAGAAGSSAGAAPRRSSGSSSQRRPPPPAAPRSPEAPPAVAPEAGDSPRHSASAERSQSEEQSPPCWLTVPGCEGSPPRSERMRPAPTPGSAPAPSPGSAPAPSPGSAPRCRAQDMEELHAEDVGPADGGAGHPSAFVLPQRQHGDGGAPRGRFAPAAPRPSFGGAPAAVAGADGQRHADPGGAPQQRPQPFSPDDVPLPRPDPTPPATITLLDGIDKRSQREKRRWDPEDQRFKTQMEWSGTPDAWEQAMVEPGTKYLCDLCGRSWDDERRMRKHRDACHGHGRGLSPSRHVTFDVHSRRGGSVRGGTADGSQLSGPGFSTREPGPPGRRGHSADARSDHSGGTGVSGADRVERASQSSLATSGLSWMVAGRRRVAHEDGHEAVGRHFASPPGSSVSSLNRLRPRGSDPNIRNPARGPVEYAGKKMIECKYCKKLYSIKSVDSHEKVCDEEPQRKKAKERREEEIRRKRAQRRSPSPVQEVDRARSLSPQGRHPGDGRRSPLDAPLVASKGTPLQKALLRQSLGDLEREAKELLAMRQKLVADGQLDSGAATDKRLRETMEEIDRRRASDGGRRVPPKGNPDASSHASSSIMRTPSQPSQKLMDARAQRKSAAKRSPAEGEQQDGEQQDGEQQDGEQQDGDWDVERP